MMQLTMSHTMLTDQSRCRLQMIAPELRFLSNLTSVNLSNNLLRFLPPIPPHHGAVFAMLVKLEHLDVSLLFTFTLLLKSLSCTCHFFKGAR